MARGIRPSIESYVVRVYRRGRTRLLVGIVEQAGVPGRRCFDDVDALWEILSSSPRRRRPCPRSSARRWSATGSIILGVVLYAMSMNAEEAAYRFRYDERLGRCVNGRGEEGYNQPIPSRSMVARDSERVDFSGRVFMYARGEGGNFRGANLDGAQFLYLNNLTRADLTGARMRGIEGDMIDLTRANLSGADLSGARLRLCPAPGVGGACLAGARFDPRTILPFSRDEALARGMAPSDGP